MSTDANFLNRPSEAEQHAAGTPPQALFDLAVNRAWSAQQRVGLAGLPAWHARTRFARRVSLPDIHRALERRPGQGEWHWAGGLDGGWTEGKAPFP